jgi:hypothetical protein
MSSRHPRFTPLLPTAVFMAALELYIHTVLAPSHLAEQLYIGIGFVIADVLLAMVIIGLLLRRVRLLAWRLGAAVCAGLFAAFLLSRTTGLPGYHEAWTSNGGLGLISLAVEFVFIGCAIASVRLRRTRAGIPRRGARCGTPPRRLRALRSSI